MKLTATIVGSLGQLMAEEVKAGEKAATAALRQAGDGLKAAWRAQIIGAGLGPRLARTIRSQAYPRSGQSLNAAVVVWSKAPVIVGAHDTGPLIRSRNGFWLAIPTPAAGKSLRGGRITPGEWERRNGLRLRFVYRRSGPSLLVAGGRLNTKGWPQSPQPSSVSWPGAGSPAWWRRPSRCAGSPRHLSSCAVPSSALASGRWSWRQAS
jgi:hypothetical protein